VCNKQIFLWIQSSTFSVCGFDECFSYGVWNWKKSMNNLKQLKHGHGTKKSFQRFGVWVDSWNSWVANDDVNTSNSFLFKYGVCTNRTYKNSVNACHYSIILISWMTTLTISIENIVLISEKHSITSNMFFI